MLKVKFKRLHPSAEIPYKATPGSAAFDLVATSCEYEPYSQTYTYGLGFATEIPKGWCAKIYARSSVFKTMLDKVGGVCIIDSDYRGEWFVKFRMPKGVWGKPYKLGERIAQCIFEPVPEVVWEESEELTHTERGSGAYGSTGR